MGYQPHALDTAAIDLESAALRWAARFGYALALASFDAKASGDPEQITRAFSAWWREAHAAAGCATK